MSINKTNYENYFLLYIDQELSASDQAAVENFVQENPEYANELASLQKAKIVPDTIIYTNKAFLYRLPEMEATLPQDFKNKLYKESSTILRPNFNYTIKAALISVAALFIIFLGYQFNQVGSTASLTRPTSIMAKTNEITAPGTNHSSEKLDQPIIVQAKNEFKHPKNNFNQTNENIYPLVNSNPIATNETPALINNDVTTVVENAPQNQNNISSINETTSAQNELAASEPLAEAPSPIESKGYKVVDTDEADRTIYIANFEIDGASFRGLSRKFNALFKRNKLEK